MLPLFHFCLALAYRVALRLLTLLHLQKLFNRIINGITFLLYSDLLVTFVLRKKFMFGSVVKFIIFCLCFFLCLDLALGRRQVHLIRNTPVGLQQTWLLILFNHSLYFTLFVIYFDWRCWLVYNRSLWILGKIILWKRASFLPTFPISRLIKLLHSRAKRSCGFHLDALIRRKPWTFLLNHHWIYWSRLINCWIR